MDDSDPMAIPPFLRRTPAARPTEETDMGRPKGSKNRTKPEGGAPSTPEGEGAGDAASPGLGHNIPVLTDDDKQRIAIGHKKAYQTALAAKKEADAKLKNVAKLAKAEITWTDGVALLKDMILLETDSGEAELRARAERARMAAIYMAAPLGSQFDFFDDRMPAVDRAYAEGKRDALAGEALRNTYDPSVPQFGRYAEGWHDGQRALIDAQKARDERDFNVTGAEEAAALAAIEANGIGGAVGAELH